MEVHSKYIELKDRDMKTMFFSTRNLLLINCLLYIMHNCIVQQSRAESHQKSYYF